MASNMINGAFKTLPLYQQTPAFQNNAFQSMRSSQARPDSPFGAPAPKTQDLESAHSKLVRTLKLTDPDSLINKTARVTGNDRKLSIFVAFSDTLVKIYQAMLNGSNKAYQKLTHQAEKAGEAPQQAQGMKRLPLGGLIA